LCDNVFERPGADLFAFQGQARFALHAARFCVIDNRERDAILDRAAGIQMFALGEDWHPQLLATRVSWTRGVRPM